MYWIEVSGYPMPRRLAGHPALEFCNTWAGWELPAAPEREWLTDYDRFAVWSGHAELVPAPAVEALRRHPDPAVLTAARELRSSLYGILTGDPAGFATVAALALRAASQARLVDDGAAAHWEIPLSPELPLLAVARSAAELLCGPDRALVRACPGEECGWLFLDRRGRRRWCSMESCGNRAKVRAHATRTKSVT